MASAIRTKRWAMTIGGTCIAAFMLLSPALPQLFEEGRPWVRQWTMYSAVGLDLPRGEFRQIAADGSVTVKSPLAAAGRERYPIRTPIERYELGIREPADLARFAAPACAALGRGERLEFNGRIARRRGWSAPVTMTVCEGGAG